MKELKQIISSILKKYECFSQEWEQTKMFIPLNMNKIEIDDIYNDENILTYIFQYRDFMNDNYVSLTDSIRIQNRDNIRIKALNSIQDKIYRYEFLKEEKGKIVLKKCLNDIVGFRYIFDEELSFEEIRNFIESNFDGIKCIYAKRDKYKAIHIYFGNNNNKRFQWELQLWNKKDEENNYNSHYKHKQAYTKWEKDEEDR